MKQLSETPNVHSVNVFVDEGVDGPEMRIFGHGTGLSLDKTTATELLPMLEHFIKTGELPE